MSLSALYDSGTAMLDGIGICPRNPFTCFASHFVVSVVHWIVEPAQIDKDSFINFPDRDEENES